MSPIITPGSQLLTIWCFDPGINYATAIDESIQKNYPFCPYSIYYKTYGWEIKTISISRIFSSSATSVLLTSPVTRVHSHISFSFLFAYCPLQLGCMVWTPGRASMLKYFALTHTTIFILGHPLTMEGFSLGRSLRRYIDINLGMGCIENSQCPSYVTTTITNWRIKFEEGFVCMPSSPKNPSAGSMLRWRSSVHSPISDDSQEYHPWDM